MTQLGSCGCCETGVEEPGHHNRPAQPALDYRIGTHATFLARMLARLAGEEIPNREHDSGARGGARPLAALTTRDGEDLAIALLDAWATAADVLTFYQERIANEGFLRTAVDRRSVLELARAIGYELNPGVAASTYLAFTVDDSASTPDTAPIPAGTQVLSIPTKQDELPQTFETSDDYEARVSWNALKPRTTERHTIELGTRQLYLAGIDNQLQPGDAILIVDPNRQPADERWDLRILQTVKTFPEQDYTLVSWAAGLGSQVGNVVIARPAPDETAEVYVFRQRGSFFGFNAPDWRTMPQEVKDAFIGDATEGPREVFTDWPGFDTPIDTAARQFDLDAIYSKLVEEDWIVLAQPNYNELYKVQAVAKASSANFALSAKTTRVTLAEGAENLALFQDHRRATVIYLQPERLVRAEKPLETPVAGDTIELAGIVAGFAKDQPLIVSGKLAESDEEPTNEVVFVESAVDDGGHTRVVLQGGLQNDYVRSTVTIYANVVRATHGETQNEVLGSGDGAQAHQRFKLKKSPLTYVSAATASGAESTLAVRVNGVLWERTSSLYGLSATAQKYIVRIDDNAEATVIFGDGKQGARLPSGQENVRANYRAGIGAGGEVDAGSLTLLKKRPFGVRSVTNLLAASGAADPEQLADARTNAPFTVLTLDRIVSLQDFENFARAFAGIGKAQAVNLWNGERYLVHLTVAEEDGDSVAEGSDLYNNLRTAIDNARDPTAEVRIDSYERLTFRLVATVQFDARYIAEEVQAAIQAALAKAFSFAQRTFGQPVTAAEIIRVIHEVEGVIAVDLDALYSVGERGNPLFVIARPTLRGRFGKLGNLLGTVVRDIGDRRPGVTLAASLLPNVASVLAKQSALASFLPAQIARWEDNEILPAQLLVIDEMGVTLTMKAIEQ